MLAVDIEIFVSTHINNTLSWQICCSHAALLTQCVSSDDGDGMIENMFLHALLINKLASLLVMEMQRTLIASHCIPCQITPHHTNHTPSCERASGGRCSFILHSNITHAHSNVRTAAPPQTYPPPPAPLYLSSRYLPPRSRTSSPDSSA